MQRYDEPRGEQEVPLLGPAFGQARSTVLATDEL